MRSGPLYSYVGIAEQHGGQTMLRTRKGEAGCVVYGPYVTLAPGRYTVDFHIGAERPLFAADAVCCRLDVRGRGTVLERAPVRPSQLATDRPVTLAFTVTYEDQYEFRVHSTGTAALTVGYERPVRLLVDETTDFSPVASRASAMTNAFFMAEFAAFRGLYTRGFRFEPGPDHVDARFGEIRFRATTRDDLQVMGEVFLTHEYNVATLRPMLFVDIGMNVGMTSLAMAARPDVREVHGFEPFAAPFGRARAHFDLNPDLARKITAHHFGLGDADEIREVRLDGRHTIGTSVRGHAEGEPETIAMRDAAPVVAALVDRARSDGLDVVLKVDCEGSEFPIFGTLDRAGLFPAVTALVVEWHKWWSPDLTQADLIAPLRRAGFTIIDRTIEADTHAGMFYAVRTAGGA